MNRQERERIIASLTDDELEQLRDRGIDVDRGVVESPEGPARAFLRAVKAERDRDWMAELADRLGLSAQAKPRTVAQIFTEPTDEPTP